MHSHKHEHHSHENESSEGKSDKEKSLHRIKIIQGHLKAIEKMIEDDKYCVDVIHQSMAVQKALKRLDMAIMENHLRTCVVDQIHSGDVDSTVKELLELYEMK